MTHDPDPRRPRRVASLLAVLTLLSGTATMAIAQGAEPETASLRADLSEANEFVRQGDYAAAERVLSELQDGHPDDPALLLMRGEVLLALERAAEARPHFERCLELSPERPRANFQLATVLQGAGDREGALAAFARELEINQDPQVKVLARLNRSVLLQQARDWAAAAAELEAVLALEPARLEAYGDAASLYLKAGRLDDAATQLERGREAGYGSAGHYYSLGAAYYKRKNYQAAGDAFRRALEVDPRHADAERSLAVALEEQGNPQEALPHLRRYLDLRPDAPDSKQVAERIRAVEGR